MNARFTHQGCKAKKVILNFFVLFLFLFAFYSFALAGSGKIDLHFENETLSANIVNTPLKSVIKKIAGKKKIWVKGSEYLTDETHSVRFRG